MRASSSGGNVIEFGAVALGFQPGLARGKIVEAFGDDREVGSQHCFIEPDQDISSGDVIAVVNEQFADDTAGGVLHLLHVRIDDDRTLRNEGAG